MRKIPRIPETEWAGLEAAWSRGPCSAAKIIEALGQNDTSWQPRTAKAVLNPPVRNTD
jgi:predicted transcriptional regulator